MSETSEYAIHPIEALDQRAKRPAIGPQTGPLSNLNSLNLSCPSLFSILYFKEA